MDVFRTSQSRWGGVSSISLSNSRSREASCPCSGDQIMESCPCFGSASRRAFSSRLMTVVTFSWYSTPNQPRRASHSSSPQVLSQCFSRNVSSSPPSFWAISATPSGNQHRVQKRAAPVVPGQQVLGEPPLQLLPIREGLRQIQQTGPEKGSGSPSASSSAIKIPSRRIR